MEATTPVFSGISVGNSDDSLVELALGGRLLAAEHAGAVAGWQSAEC